MNDELNSEQGLTPEQRLEATNSRLFDACLATIHDLDTLQACVAYENRNQQRVRVLELLARRAQEIRDES